MGGVACYILERVIIRSQGAGSRLEDAVGNDTTGKISVVVYALAIPLAFVHIGDAYGGPVPRVRCWPNCWGNP